ncbi:Cytochrome c oxidase assembly protein cox15 [Coemansia sp. RSA 1821]|nr:cytochrome oxidase assembly protein-domain-containing protein [Coemansia mojavensis]KAJ1747796.1 Cytochrome c oxidase assembly protein cox15 [Coemansia sp. RSA 1821]KAJ2673006.1 Cytochrome c oxidase assembly protein cox15 [Coemansia sp. RSA 1085]
MLANRLYTRIPALCGRASFLAAEAVSRNNRGVLAALQAHHRPLRQLATAAFRGDRGILTALKAQHTPLRQLATAASPMPSKGGKRTADAPIVGYWSLFCASMVFGIVVWGGLTRLTESGLSIVEWKPITGAKLPTSDQEWEAEFAKYKQFPEYHKVHIGIDMDDFKRIYFMEWFHRNIGRLFGVVYLVPAAYFIAKGKVTRRGALKLSGLGLLLLGQGAMGWYMVASGLEKELAERPEAIPRVSQYRLTSHLSLAYLLYAGLALYGWNVLRTNRLARSTLPKDKIQLLLQSPEITSFRRKITAATLLVGTTCLSGAMVAGLDAGLLFNEFPMMDVTLPQLWHSFYARHDAMWLNLFENPATVQLEHRILALTTYFVLSALWFKGRKLPLPQGSRLALHAMYLLANLQVALGISTLVNGVPIANASAHQANSVLLLASALRLYHTLRPLPRF